MEASIHRFVRLLRGAGVRISVPEVVDALRCAGQPGILADRETLRAALSGSLVKDRRDQPVFEEIFDAFFALVRVGPGDEGAGHTHAHDDLGDTGELRSYTMSAEPSPAPRSQHEHGEPVDLREYFDTEDLAQSYNLHQEATKVDLAAMTDEIVFSSGNEASGPGGHRVQLEADRLRGANVPGRLSRATGTRVDADLSVAQQEALLGWLAAADDEFGGGDADQGAERLSGMFAGLPEALKHHLEALLAIEQRVVESRERRLAAVDSASERERAELEAALRALASTLRGGRTHRRRVAARGRVDPCRTMRRTMRFDGVPFSPVTVSRAEDRPRLVVLADVSLSVRATARFTLHLVHGLQDLFAQVRSFAFVSDIVEITELFAEHPAERALGLVFGGDVLDVDANSDYGAALGAFAAEHASAVTRRTTLLVLGDGRGNGNDPNLPAMAEIARRARETIWLTPEPRYSWRLGGCDLPRYAEYCDRVRVVRDLSGLEHAAREMVMESTGR